MSVTLLKGTPVAQQLYSKIKEKVGQSGLVPHLAVVLVGDDPASQTYVRSKQRRCEKLGFRSTLVPMPADSSQAAVEAQVRVLSTDPDIHGILVQLPLPGGLNPDPVIEVIDPRKDVDGLHPDSLGRLTTADAGMIPCTPAGIVELLRYYQIDTTGRRVVVVGRSRLVGEPIARLLSGKFGGNATVTVCHTRTIDLKAEVARAEILVMAAGQPQMIEVGDCAQDAVVVDVGIHRTEAGLVGDFDPTGAEGHLSAYSPVPGGIGPLTVAMLMRNTFNAAEKLEGKHG